MDEPKIPYREKFEKLATRKGEIVAIVSNSMREVFALDEGYLLKAYEETVAHNATIPDHLNHASCNVMAVEREARAAIQDYKIKHDIPIDTPLVSETSPPQKRSAANDENYDADIRKPEF